MLGVFEVYTDADALVKRAERAQLAILIVILGIFLLLYAILLIILRRAATLLDRQQGVITERTHTLELLSAQLLTAQEDERKRIAAVLHEDVAQTLSAVKLKLEGVRRGRNDKGVDPRGVDSLLPFILDAIQDVRVLAMRLRPSSLDDLGLTDALAWLLRDLGELYPKLLVRSRVEVREEDIARPLKTIIYRTIQDTLNNIACHSEADRVEVSVKREGDCVELSIAENGIDYQPVAHGPSRMTPSNSVFAQMKERTRLSGGEFHVGKDGSGGTLGIARWTNCS